MKFKLKYEVISFLAILAVAVFSVYFYLNAPDLVPSHWNFQGEVDDYSSKTFIAIFGPVLTLGLYLLFWLLPKIDPKKERYAEFAGVYAIFRTVIIVFLAGIFLVTGLAGLGYDVNIAKIVPLAVGVLFVTMGYFLDRVKSNWFVGIRTPWTLSSETVWQKTHRLGRYTFMIAGVVFAGGAFLAETKFYPHIFIGAILLAAVAPVVYSYLLYRGEKH